MNTFVKIAFFILGTLFCIIVGLWPEAAMYFVYNLIAPTTEMSRILVLALFWLGGAGVCLAFGVLSVVMWMGLIATCIE